MQFYQASLGGSLDFTHFPDSDVADKGNESGLSGVMHSTLTVGASTLMASDSAGEHCKVIPGNDVAICINFDSLEKIQSAFNALSVDATIENSLDKAFWGAWFAQFIDKFGKRWMLHYHEDSGTCTEAKDVTAKKRKAEEEKP
eukprot:CAMPEP_0170365908 /NCGR_PEP_ID=MMETSP0117_2-20130122/6146_1 /TAXON_ID=400756 /ORGANISM="Durinskia baltica, Strain CSIRO CS-38" /LENGTH=142 /DNA_ID=CAMNT_0010620483 /DNA_START=90 /DNA_END=518 /DNA_ORIENTATION=-